MVLVFFVIITQLPITVINTIFHIVNNYGFLLYLIFKGL